MPSKRIPKFLHILRHHVLIRHHLHIRQQRHRSQRHRPLLRRPPAIEEAAEDQVQYAEGGAVIYNGEKGVKSGPRGKK